jgi:NAD(P)-dependent dehydrogenase (short-subunit alcohol dehydrogenase family)
MQTYPNNTVRNFQVWPLLDRIAVVTGGSNGIGRATCRALAREHAKVVVVGRTAGHVDETLRQVREADDGATLLGLVVDVRCENQIEGMARRVLEEFGAVDILVTSAGIGTRPKTVGPNPGFQITSQEWDAVLDTNLRGVFLTVRAILPAMMLKGGGDIVNVGSARGGIRGLPFAAAYSASKFGLMGFSEALAEEVRDCGVRVHVLLPDVTDSALLHDTAVAAVNLGPLLAPSRVAEVIVDLIKLPGDTMLDRPLVAAHPTRSVQRVR